MLPHLLLYRLLFLCNISVNLRRKSEVNAYNQKDPLETAVVLCELFVTSTLKTQCKHTCFLPL